MSVISDLKSRKDGESYLSYFKRIIQLVREDKIDYSEMGDCLLGSKNVYSSENHRKFYYIANKIVDNFENDYFVTDNDLINEIERQKDELYKERVKLRDKNREYNRKLIEDARFENLKEILSEEIKNLEPIVLNTYKEPISPIKTVGVAQFSDWHALKIIDNQWNVYNKDVLIQRANNIADKVIQKSKLHSVTDLVVEINGDMIDGIIQVSGRNVDEADTISQIIFVSELLAQIINKLKPNYESLKIATTLGNHGRLYESKKMGMTKENFEMLIPEFLKLRLGNDIPIIKSYGLDFTAYEINGEMICVTHGQNDRLSTVISDFSKMYKRVPKEIHLGHTHEYKDLNDCDIYVTVNGCLDGSDDFAITCRKITKPAQNFIVYGEDRCIYNLLAD